MASRSSKKTAAGKKGKRERMPAIFVQLRAVSARCLKSSLPDAEGDPEDSPNSINGADSCLQLIRLQKQIKQQLQDMKTDLLTRRTFHEDIDSSFNVSLNAARDPLEDEICSVRNKELALHRMQTFHALLSSLQKDPSQRPSVLAVMRHHVDNSRQIFKVQMTNRDLEAQLISIRKKRMEIRIRQQDLFQKLKYSGKTSQKICGEDLKAFSKERESLEKITNHVVILQEVFQRCVMSAKVHWAEDPYLKSLLLRMNDANLS